MTEEGSYVTFVDSKPPVFEFAIVHYGRWLMWKRPGQPIEYASDLTLEEQAWLDQQDPMGAVDFSTFPQTEVESNG